MNKENIHYYEHLAELYPTISSASSEIINLQSLLHLPKGTEHFLSDIHGEYDAFSHVLRNGSGAVRKKIDDVFGHTLGAADKTSLATLIYYPQKKIALVKKTESDMESWYKTTLYRLIEVCKIVSSKYTRSKLRKALPTEPWHKNQIQQPPWMRASQRCTCSLLPSVHPAWWSRP